MQPSPSGTFPFTSICRPVAARARTHTYTHTARIIVQPSPSGTFPSTRIYRPVAARARTHTHTHTHTHTKQHAEPCSPHLQAHFHLQGFTGLSLLGHAHTHMHTYTHAHTYKTACRTVQPSPSGTFPSTRICRPVAARACIYTHTHIHTHSTQNRAALTFRHISIYKDLQACRCKGTHTHTLIHTYTHTRTHTARRTVQPSPSGTFPSTRIYRPVAARARTHTHIHTYTHAHTYTNSMQNRATLTFRHVSIHKDLQACCCQGILLRGTSLRRRCRGKVLMHALRGKKDV